MPSDAFVEAADMAVQKCAANGTLTRAKYDCAMRAASIDELTSCRIDDFS